MLCRLHIASCYLSIHPKMSLLPQFNNICSIVITVKVVSSNEMIRSLIRKALIDY